MRERAQLPDNYTDVFTGLMEAAEFEDASEFGDLTSSDELQGARENAWQMATDLSARLDELDLNQFDVTYHDFPKTDGSIRVAITPPYGNFDPSSGPVWRIVINEGQTVYKDGKPKERWDIMDILVEPGELRLSVNTASLNYVIGYGEMGSPPGVPPRITRDVKTYQYTQSGGRGYCIALPEAPPATADERLRSYQDFSSTVGTVLDVFGKLSEVTKRDATTNLEQTGEI